MMEPIKLTREEYNLSIKTQKLNLSNRNLTTVPEFLLEMPWIKHLSISNNNIESIENLQNLTNLEILYAFKNKISKIENLENLRSLQRLDLSDNFLREINGFENLSNLKNLYLSRNPITDLSNLEKSGLDLDNLFLDGTLVNDIRSLKIFIRRGLECSLKSISHRKVIFLQDCPLPEQIQLFISQGSTALLNYFSDLEEQGEDTIFEARLFILGEAGVGKTTFARKIKDSLALMPAEIDDTTVGIDVSKHVFKIKNPKDNPFHVNIWDFGGQQIYHSTHQLFLSKRSLYVIIGNGRKEDNPELYWLPIQKLLCDDSPVLLVVNKRANLNHEIPFNQLRTRFPNLRDPLIEIDLRRDISQIAEVQSIIEHHIRNLPQFLKGEKLPKKWVTLRETLKTLKRNYISIDQFYDICNSNGLFGFERQKFVLDYLNDMGIVLYFDVPHLRKLVILNTSWLTEAIYKILDHTKEKRANGRFTEEELEKVWSDPSYKAIFDELLLIMEKFELCYKLPISPVEYLVPKLVQNDVPENLSWDKSETLQVRYEYDVMPKGILQRLIVRRHALLSKTINVWKYGAVFEFLSARALVLLESPTKLTISASGLKRGSLIEMICVEIDSINSDYKFSKDTDVRKRVPCICPHCIDELNPTYYDYADLIRRYSKKIQTIECSKEYSAVNVEKLLSEVFDQGIKVTDGKLPLIFISYSQEDEAYLKEFRGHLRFIEKESMVFCDHEITPGGDWDAEIKKQLSQADVIVFLVSASLYNTDYVRNVEIPLALDRLKEKEKPPVLIPVIIRNCAWQDSVFGTFTAAPHKGMPISAWNDRDAGWKEVVLALKKVIGR